MAELLRKEGNKKGGKSAYATWQSSGNTRLRLVSH